MARDPSTNRHPPGLTTTCPLVTACRWLSWASERVRARYGFACTRTDEEQRRLEPWMDRFGADELVHIRAGA